MTVQRVFHWLERQQQPHTAQLVMALIVVRAFCSAMITEVIGIHTIFGAFMFGVIMPRKSALIREFTVKIEDFTTVVLLPLFFAYTGLRTQIGLLNQPALWLVCLLVIVVATAGKFGGAMLAALGRPGMASGLGDWRADEYARPDGADRAQYRP